MKKEKKESTFFNNELLSFHTFIFTSVTSPVVRSEIISPWNQTEKCLLFPKILLHDPCFYF